MQQTLIGTKLKGSYSNDELKRLLTETQVIEFEDGTILRNIFNNVSFGDSQILIHVCSEQQSKLSIHALTRGDSTSKGKFDWYFNPNP